MSRANGLSMPAKVGDSLSVEGVSYILHDGPADGNCIGCAARYDDDLCRSMWQIANCGGGVWRPALVEQTELSL